MRKILGVNLESNPRSQIAASAALFCVLTLASASAFAANGSWYLGASGGQSRFSNLHSNETEIAPGSFGSTDTGYWLTAGWNVTSYLAVEGGYVRFGDVSGSNVVPGAPQNGFTCGLVCEQSYAVKLDLAARGWTLELVGTAQLTDSFGVFFRVGGIEAHSELDANYTPLPPYNTQLPPANNSSNDFGAAFGIGAEWNFTNSWALRLAWDRFQNFGHDLPERGLDGLDLNLASLGIVYQF